MQRRKGSSLSRNGPKLPMRIITITDRWWLCFYRIHSFSPHLFSFPSFSPAQVLDALKQLQKMIDDDWFRSNHLFCLFLLARIKKKTITRGLNTIMRQNGNISLARKKLASWPEKSAGEYGIRVSLLALERDSRILTNACEYVKFLENFYLY